ncbi:MAG: glycosyltransferase family 2 protein [Phycisphaerae bacterium]
MAVIIPCYNQGRFLPEAVAGVRAQTWPRVELIVVDDGSTDGAVEAALGGLNAEGVRVVRQSNRGLAAARNAGVRASSAPFFVPLDADDRLRPGFIEALLPPLLAEPRLGYCYCHTRLFGAQDALWPCRPYDPLRLLAENLGPATAVVRREAFERVGGYSSDMTEGLEDWDFWIALLSAGYAGHCVPEPLFEYRRHADGSMLTRLGEGRAAMLRRMAEHHTATFARLLGTRVDVDEVLAAQAALVRVYAIEDARSWRLAGWLAGMGPLRAGADPRRRLAAIENSRTYRLIRRLKRPFGSGSG